MKLLTRIRSLWTTQPPEDGVGASRSRALGRDHHGRQRPLGAQARAAGRRGPPGGHEGAASRSRGSDRPRRRVAGGLRLLDRELVAHARRDRHAHGDLRRDDRPGVSRPRSPGRESPLHRAPRPGTRGAPAQDGEPRAADDREHDGSGSGSHSTTVGGPRSSRRRGSSSSPASSRGRSTRTSSPRTSTPPRCPIPTSSSAPRASCASRTSCSGSSRTRSSCSSTATGRTSRREISSPPCRRTPAAAAASAVDEPARVPRRRRGHRATARARGALGRGLVAVRARPAGGAAGAARVLRHDEAAAPDPSRGLRRHRRLAHSRSGRRSRVGDRRGARHARPRVPPQGARRDTGLVDGVSRGHAARDGMDRLRAGLRAPPPRHAGVRLRRLAGGAARDLRRRHRGVLRRPCAWTSQACARHLAGQDVGGIRLRHAGRGARGVRRAVRGPRRVPHARPVAPARRRRGRGRSAGRPLRVDAQARHGREGLGSPAGRARRRARPHRRDPLRVPRRVLRRLCVPNEYDETAPTLAA